MIKQITLCTDDYGQNRAITQDLLNHSGCQLKACWHDRISYLRPVLGDDSLCADADGVVVDEPAGAGANALKN